MLARLRGFTDVPEQDAQNEARMEGVNTRQNSDRATQPLQPCQGLREAPGSAAHALRNGGLQGHRSLREPWLRPPGASAAGLSGRKPLPGWLLKPQAAPWAEHLSAGLASGLGAVLAAGLGTGWVPPLRAEPAPRPADLKILEEKTTMREGTHWLGVYGRVAERDQPGIWRVKLWREWSDRVEISSESIDCRPGRATRAGVTASKVVVQTLNPGGPINPANRLDHLIWWASCFPEQAGRDPAGLGPLARSLGFDGHQSEHFEVLSVPPLPHP